MTTSERAPAASADSTVSSSARSGTATTTRSAWPSRSRREARRGLPNSSPPRGLTRWTGRRSAPSIAAWASQYPHDSGFVEAPATAIERGAKSGPGRDPPHAPTRARSRAMISRWMSDVPSQISSSFASRNHFSTGYSREYPNPPSVCTAAQVANIETSEA